MGRSSRTAARVMAGKRRARSSVCFGAPFGSPCCTGRPAVQGRRKAAGAQTVRPSAVPSRYSLPVGEGEGRVDLPTNGGHPVKSVNSTEEVHHGSNATHLHPRV